MMNNIYQIIRKLTLSKTLFNKISIKTVIRFFQVDLNKHETLITYHFTGSGTLKWRIYFNIVVHVLGKI